ncbi:LytR/AlgR family response regulator transcription factor [Dyadobacter sp. 32]|uniref:LytR/AlgR family response regulator transcription factor n=1 Tax=Dyadobacter sp. 32 TaxID=538966 RepID=UPI0039C5D8BD
MNNTINHTFTRIQYPDINQASKPLEVISYGKIVLVNMCDITHLRGDGNYTFVHTIDGKQYLFSKTMKQIQKKLDVHFVRVHKSYTVNPDHVVSWLEARTILLRCGRQIPVARRRVHTVEQCLRDEYRDAG